MTDYPEKHITDIKYAIPPSAKQRTCFLVTCMEDVPTITNEDAIKDPA